MSTEDTAASAVMEVAATDLKFRNSVVVNKGYWIPPTPDPKPGIGGAPTRATTLPEGAAERKQYPMATGLLFYFPDALAAVSNVSWRGSQQHNPDKPIHWDRSKSEDEADTTIRHLSQSGTLDTDGVRHTAKAAWRILALLQKEIEQEGR